jgi:aldose sugar dehydrogenase
VIARLRVTWRPRVRLPERGATVCANLPLMRVTPALIALVVAGCSKSPTGTGQRVPGKPVETLAPNGETQKPATAHQTRAPYTPTNDVSLAVRSVTRGLEHPWALAFLEGGRMLVTERTGKVRVVTREGVKSEPLAGVPEVDSRDQGGLMDIVVLPGGGAGDVLLSFSEKREGGNGTSVARAKLVLEGTPRLEGTKVVWRQTPTIASTKHFGSRIVPAPDGNVFVTLGERYDPKTRTQSQRLDSALGKVVRITPDGAPAAGNPFAGQAGALPEIWSKGHRNVQAAAIHPSTKELWVVEHGARGGDEVNVSRAGKDYGWPTITYGIDYSGKPIGEGITSKEGMEQPLYYWDPSIAPSGMAFYDGALFPSWKGNLLVGALAGKHVSRLVLDGERVVGEERLMTDHGRVRDVRVGPTGSLWILTDEEDGELLEVTPAATPK